MNWVEPHPKRLPTPNEILRIKDEVALLDFEIASLYTYLRELERDRDNKASFVAPIRRIPPEILGDIAMACLQVGIPPYILSQVSSLMRDAVNGMKKLWSSIHYFVPRGQNMADKDLTVTPVSRPFMRDTSVHMVLSLLGGSPISKQILAISP
ncbi:15214_t:CDS:1, partial [Acaulospora colombiana]